MKTNGVTSANKPSPARKSTVKKKKSKKPPTADNEDVGSSENGSSSIAPVSDGDENDDVQKTLNFTLTDESDSVNNSDTKVTKKNKRASMPGNALSKLSDDNVSSSDKETTTNTKKSKKARKSMPAKLAVNTESEATEKLDKSEPAVKKDSAVGEVVEPVLNLSEEPAATASSKKKKSKKSLSAEDAPKPFVEFISKDTPKAFARKKSAKTEPRKARAKAPIEKVLQTPQTEVKKSVVIDTSKNMAIGKKELKFSPLPVFDPKAKPKKGLMKTPVRRSTRNKASDYF